MIESLYTPRSVAPTDAKISVDPSHLAELAHHCCEASVGGDTRKATEYSVLAGRHATVVLAFEEAVRHFERALSVRSAGAVSDGDGRLLLELADARLSSGDPAACGEALGKDIAAARAAADVECLAEAAIRLSRYKIGGNVLTAVPQRTEVLEEALASLRTVSIRIPIKETT